MSADDCLKKAIELYRLGRGGDTQKFIEASYYHLAAGYTNNTIEDLVQYVEKIQPRDRRLLESMSKLMHFLQTRGWGLALSRLVFGSFPIFSSASLKDGAAPTEPPKELIDTFGPEAANLFFEYIIIMPRVVYDARVLLKK